MTPRPQRLTLRRSRGFDLEALSRSRNGLPAKRVTRPGKWGNPFVIEEIVARLHLGPEAARDRAVELHRAWITGTLDAALDPGRPPPPIGEVIAELAGHNLACWCKPGQSCHADVLILLANF